MGNVVKRIIWFCAIVSMMYTSVSCYMIAGWFAANGGIELPMWGKMMSILGDVLAWCAGVK